jgi:hypothetical protein
MKFGRSEIKVVLPQPTGPVNRIPLFKSNPWFLQFSSEAIAYEMSL